MIPLQIAEGPEIGSRSRGGRAGDESFAGYLENRLAERRRSENALGAGRAEARADGPGRTGREAVRSDRNKGGSAAEITALVGEFLGLLREQAQDLRNGPGTWRVAIDEPSQLAALAARAGMDQADTTALLTSLEQNQGVFEMGEFLARLSRHFLEMDHESPVLVPETDLPYLQLLLSRLGVPTEEVERLGEQAVRGDNTLNLVAFLQGLEDLNPQAFELPDGNLSLTGWDAEQLLVVLDAAGVSRALQRELLPELHAPWEQPQRPNLPLELDLGRFRELLARGLAEVQSGRPQADIPEFLAQLKEIFTRADFAEQRVGWSPAVQGAVEKIYGQLLESVDLAAVKVERVGPVVSLKEELRLAEKFAEPEKDALVGGRMVAQAVAQAGLAADGEAELNGESFSGRHFLSELREHGRGGEAVPATDAGSADNPRAEALRAPAGPPRFSSQWEQQIFNRISSGVTAGLQRNEHHLVMHLYPRELGEVRVEMLVRDNQVSLSFAMENSKVKEVLERHMDLFRESLERRGFQLGECMVSVDRQGRDESGEAWQRFTSAWSNQRGSGMVRRENLAEVPESVLYQRPSGSGREQGVDLFA